MEIAHCSDLSIVYYFLGDFKQALFTRLCHEDETLARKSNEGWDRSETLQMAQTYIWAAVCANVKRAWLCGEYELPIKT